MTIIEFQDALLYDAQVYSKQIIKDIHDPIDLYNALPEDEFFELYELEPLIASYNENKLNLLKDYDKETIIFLLEYTNTDPEILNKVLNDGVSVDDLEFSGTSGLIDSMPTINELLSILWFNCKNDLLKIFNFEIQRYDEEH